MGLKEQLKDDLKTAMKAKDNFKRDVIRFLMSAVKQVEVDERRDLNDEDVLKLIQKSVKQRDDSVTQFRDAGRNDLADKEEKEAELLKTYLPKQLSDEELKALVSEAITESGATSMKDMGRVMGLAMKNSKGQADGKRINQFVKELLM